MCRADEKLSQRQDGSKQEGKCKNNKNANKESIESHPQPPQKEEIIIDNVNKMPRRRRGKRVKQKDLPKSQLPSSSSSSSEDGFRLVTTKKKVKKSGSRSRHEGESQSGGVESLLPSFIAVLVLGCGLVAKMGFRGRATVAGIDLGTTNSVICVQQQSKGKEGEQTWPLSLSGTIYSW